MPAGLLISGDTLSGTPETGTQGVYHFCVQVADGGGQLDWRMFRLVIHPAE
ncbi:MAG: Ig domain-containing protein [Ardenticatenaceae bacterium]